MHKLSLNISANLGCNGLRVEDTSVYNPILGEPVNIILEIKPPGQDCFIPFTVTKGFDTTYTCNLLKVCCSSCSDELTSLPDGNYEIKFSVDPNLYTIVEYNHFRNCSQFKQYLFLNCKLWKERCLLSKKEFKKKLQELYYLKELIMSEKYAAEECLDVTIALENYSEAENIINKLSDGKGCSTC